MKAMLFEKPGAALAWREVPDPKPDADQLLLRVLACGVCRTDLHLIDGELPNPKTPVIPGHEVVGEVISMGARVSGFSVGDRVGVPWLGWTCSTCAFCTSGRENLCDQAKFTGYQIDGGYAERMVTDHRYAFPMTASHSAQSAAPLLCAGLIGYRSLKLAGSGRRLGIYGFGAAAHIVAQVAISMGHELYAFTREGDVAAQAFAKSLGAVWVGSSQETPPVPLDAAIIFAPVGMLVPAALRATVKGGTVVCGGIHMSDIPAFPYSVLWGERVLRSVANLTRQDALEFLPLATRISIATHTVPYSLERANEALADLRHGRIQGAAVLLPNH